MRNFKNTGPDGWIERTQRYWPEYHNPYYDPDKCGLKVIAVLDEEDLCYEYDTVILWQDKATGRMYVGHDAGCSCPTPFEDFHSLDDMTEVHKFADLEAFIKEYTQYGVWNTTDFLRDARKYLF